MDVTMNAFDAPTPPVDFTPPASLEGDSLDGELAAAGWPDAHCSMVGDSLEVTGLPVDVDLAAVQAVITAHVAPSPPPSIPEQLAAAPTVDAKLDILIGALGL